jgi:hypothetical protein
VPSATLNADPIVPAGACLVGGPPLAEGIVVAETAS